MLYGVCVILLLAASNYATFKLWRYADERADNAEEVLAKSNVVAKIVKEYVHEIVYKPVPDSVIAARVDRLCKQRLRDHRPNPDGPAPTDADNRRDRDLDRELVETWRNSRQLARLQEAARAAGCAK